MFSQETLVDRMHDCGLWIELMYTKCHITSSMLQTNNLDSANGKKKKNDPYPLVSVILVPTYLDALVCWCLLHLLARY